MRNDRNARCSDLDQARAAAKRLRPRSLERVATGRARATSGTTSVPVAAAEPFVLDSGWSERANAATAPAHPDIPRAGVASVADGPARGTLSDEIEELCVWPTDNLGSRLWNEVLTECLDLVRTEEPSCAFAVDAQGLAIAHVGDASTESIEGTGARLAIALEQAARMEAFPDRLPVSLSIDYGDRWLTGLAVQGSNDMRVVLGVITRELPAPRTRSRLVHLIAEVLTR